MMFMQPAEKNATLKFNSTAEIYCPSDSDRIKTL